MNPEPFTLRELCWMEEAASRDRWKHTSKLLALIANVNRDPKKCREFVPDDFNPYASKRETGTRVTPENIDALQALLPPDKRAALKEKEGS